MKLDQKEIEKFIREARNEEAMDVHAINKSSFQHLLTSMMIKVLNRKGAEAETQLAVLRRMDDFVERLTFKNCIYIFQCKTITAQDRQIEILHQEKLILIEENQTLKKEINGED